MSQCQRVRRISEHSGKFKKTVELLFYFRSHSEPPVAGRNWRVSVRNSSLQIRIFRQKLSYLLAVSGLSLASVALAPEGPPVQVRTRGRRKGMWMKTALSLFSILLFSAQTVFANVDPTERIDEPRSVHIPNLVLNGIYKVEATVQVKPRAWIVGGETIDNIDNVEVKIDPNEPFAVRIEKDEVFLTPIIASELHGIIPDTYRFATGDLDGAGMKFVSDGDQYTLYANYSEYKDTLVAAGQCKALVERKLGFWVPGICAATMSADKLAKVGFHSADCESAEIKVWGGGHGGCGHVAWRTSGGASGWSSGDYVGDPGHLFYAKGCYSRGGGFSSGNSSWSSSPAPKRVARVTTAKSTPKRVIHRKRRIRRSR